MRFRNVFSTRAPAKPTPTSTARTLPLVRRGTSQVQKYARSFTPRARLGIARPSTLARHEGQPSTSRPPVSLRLIASRAVIERPALGAAGDAVKLTTESVIGSVGV